MMLDNQLVMRIQSKNIRGLGAAPPVEGVAGRKQPLRKESREKNLRDLRVPGLGGSCLPKAVVRDATKALYGFQTNDQGRRV